MLGQRLKHLRQRGCRFWRRKYSWNWAHENVWRHAD